MWLQSDEPVWRSVETEDMLTMFLVCWYIYWERNDGIVAKCYLQNRNNIIGKKWREIDLVATKYVFECLEIWYGINLSDNKLR